MSSLPRFTPEENFRRIKRQKNHKFIVVEGSDDVAIYDSCLNAMGACDLNYDIFHSEGKIPIRDFVLSDKKSSNVVFIIDKDFHDFEVVDSRVVTLDRYSIENYFICDFVIGASLQLVLGCRFQDVRNYFSLDEFLDNVSSSVNGLLRVVFYHQNYVVKNKLRHDNPAWSETFLCDGNSWRVCPQKVDDLMSKLAPSPDLIAAADTYFESNFRKSDHLIKDFPGKLLKHSLQRYLFTKLNSVKPSASAKFGNVESMKILLSSTLYRSSDLKAILNPVVKFVGAK